MTLGYERVHEWPSVFWHPVRRMLLIVYVDDMKLAGPKEHMVTTWEALGKNIKLEVPKGDVVAGTPIESEEEEPRSSIASDLKESQNNMQRTSSFLQPEHFVKFYPRMVFH